MPLFIHDLHETNTEIQSHHLQEIPRTAQIRQSANHMSNDKIFILFDIEITSELHLTKAIYFNYEVIYSLDKRIKLSPFCLSLVAEQKDVKDPPCIQGSG